MLFSRPDFELVFRAPPERPPRLLPEVALLLVLFRNVLLPEDPLPEPLREALLPPLRAFLDPEDLDAPDAWPLLREV